MSEVETFEDAIDLVDPAGETLRSYQRVLVASAGPNDCKDCGYALTGRHAGWCPSYPTPEIAAKRKEMQAKLEAVTIDTAEPRARLSSRRAIYDPERTDSDRLSIAKDILLVMIASGGEKLGKVRAAVEYADLLIAEIDGVEIEDES